MTANVRLNELCVQDRTIAAADDTSPVLGLDQVEGSTGQIALEQGSKAAAGEGTYFAFTDSHVLYCKLRPYLNKVALPGSAGRCSTELVPLKPAEGVDRRYLAYLLRSRSILDAAIASASGARMPRTDMDVFLRHKVRKHSSAEQRHIIDVLDRAASIEQLRKAADDKVRELVPALFVEMFGDPASNPKGWTTALLGTLVQEFRYGTSQKSGQSGLPVLRIPNVISDTLSTDEIKLVELSEADERRLCLTDGDVLFVRTNGNPDYVGRSAVYARKMLDKAGFDGARCVYASYLIRARLNDDLHPIYLQAFLSSVEGRRALREKSQTSAGQYNINTEALASIRVMVPPFEIQTDFADRVLALSSTLDLAAGSKAIGGQLTGALSASLFG